MKKLKDNALQKSKKFNLFKTSLQGLDITIHKRLVLLIITCVLYSLLHFVNSQNTDAICTPHFLPHFTVEIGHTIVNQNVKKY